MENMVYLNITAGISDPTTLNSPPVGCENAEMVSAHYVRNLVAHFVNYVKYIRLRNVS